MDNKKTATGESDGKLIKFINCEKCNTNFIPNGISCPYCGLSDTKIDVRNCLEVLNKNLPAYEKVIPLLKK